MDRLFKKFQIFAMEAMRIMSATIYDLLVLHAFFSWIFEKYFFKFQTILKCFFFFNIVISFELKKFYEYTVAKYYGKTLIENFSY